jgi:hypothetical protein
MLSRGEELGINGEKAMREIFKINRMIKKLKLIGYVLAYIGLFIGVIIAINYIEGNGIRSAINYIRERIESPQARGDVQLVEAPGSFANAISGECWMINDEKVARLKLWNNLKQL